MVDRQTLALLPDALSYARIVLTAGTYLLAYTGDRGAFTVAMLVIVLTDMLDGPIARRLHIEDREGADLDSVSDFFFYASLPFWAWMLRPQIILDHYPVIILVFIAYAAANLLARRRLGQFGFHNQYTRFAATVGVVFALSSILWGISPLIYWTAIAAVTVDLTLRFAAIIRGPGRGANPASPPARAGRDTEP